MDAQWQSQSYSESPGASRRQNGGAPHQQQHQPQQISHQQVPRDYAGHPQSQHHQQVPAVAPGLYKYDQQHQPYHGSAAPASASPLAGAPQFLDGNGDVAMHDAHDAHAGIKYAMRPHHQSQPSSGSRPSQLHSPQEPSSAAQRYSPMDTLSPGSSSPYASKPPPYGAPPARQSPTRPEYSSSPYFAGRQPGQQLPPLSTYTSTHDNYPASAISNLDGSFNDPKSPRRQVQPMPLQRGPVPEFRKLRSTADLRPKNNHQPAFRRANPEGGFISVSDIITEPTILAQSNAIYSPFRP